MHIFWYLNFDLFNSNILKDLIQILSKTINVFKIWRKLIFPELLCRLFSNATMLFIPLFSCGVGRQPAKTVRFPMVTHFPVRWVGQEHF